MGGGRLGLRPRAWADDTLNINNCSSTGFCIIIISTFGMFLFRFVNIVQPECVRVFHSEFDAVYDFAKSLPVRRHNR